MKTVVAKFGGTSLADAGQFQKIKDIIEKDPSRRFIVASAPGKRFPEDIKVTDMLLRCYQNAKNGEDYEQDLTEIKKRFQEIMETLNIDFPIDKEIEIIRKHLSENPDDQYMASRGEYLNSQILASYLGFTFVDPAWCVCFNEDGTLDNVMTKRAMSAALRPLKNAVVAGFYGADAEGRIHTFSRGGSDVTGSLVASAIEADLYENWTDVSGLLAADPRIVDSPKSVEYLSYRELRTLSYMGASVLHTDAVLPASNLGIPINIRNTNRPEDPGTTIVRKLPEGKVKYPVVGVAGRIGMSVIQVEKVMVSDGSGFSAVMLDILKERNLPFEQCLTGIDTITLVIRSDLLNPCKDELLEEIKAKLSPDYLGIKENLSMIAVVGERGTESSDANVKVLHALDEAGIEISTINQGAGKLNLLIGVPEERYKDAIRAVYSSIDSSLNEA
ncbi:aspartate kinase [Oribacterium sp. KHPX15]|uniref:aspartate kinase n=1 Tax=unclassified Oribacterium TaxID=2629782 RepID=UPI0004E0E030|nr:MULTISPECIES: aspartate kinase [unclassified Oribacterium]SEA50226.1 aspartate kinase [Oribacterium sp. KHPX15]